MLQNGKLPSQQLQVPFLYSSDHLPAYLPACSLFLLLGPFFLHPLWCPPRHMSRQGGLSGLRTRMYVYVWMWLSSPLALFSEPPRQARFLFFFL